MANTDSIPRDPLAIRYIADRMPATRRPDPQVSGTSSSYWHTSISYLQFDPFRDSGWSTYLIGQPRQDVLRRMAHPTLAPTPDNPSEFLKAQPELLSIVTEAERKLNEAFGEGTVVKKELVFEEAEETAYPVLFLIAQVDLPVENAREIMRNLDESWWLDQLEAVQGKVQLDFEFR